MVCQQTGELMLSNVSSSSLCLYFDVTERTKDQDDVQLFGSGSCLHCANSHGVTPVPAELGWERETGTWVTLGLCCAPPPAPASPWPGAELVPPQPSFCPPPPSAWRCSRSEP